MAQTVTALFATAKDHTGIVKKIAQQYIQSGMEILYLEELDFEQAKSLAESKNMSHLLYFQDQEHLTMVSFQDDMGGFTVELLVSDLQNK